MAGPSQRADRMSLRVLARASVIASRVLFVAVAGCTGGPHPLPPSQGVGVATNGPPKTVPTTASNPTGTPGFGDTAAGSAATPTIGAGGAPATTPPLTPSSGPTPAAPAATAAAGASAPTSGVPAGMTPPPAAAGTAGSSGGAAGSGSPSQPAECDGGTDGVLSASETAPTTMLLVLDRSVDMASDFQGAPRWQRASEALMRTLSPRAAALTLGATLYPSAGTTCTGPAWLCQLQSPAMCTVTPMASQDQVAFQPASQALGTLVGPSGVYAPVTAAGVPLGESLQRADVALAAQPASATTSVVIIASGTPSCDWDSARASAILKRWYADRGVRTYVIALPGSPGATSDALAALAEAGGTAEVRSPQSVGALQAMLQSVVFDSLGSCSLELDPPAADPASVQVRVTETGVEQSLPRSSSSGETLWTISPDGKTVTLLGTACEAAKSGAYDAIRIVLGCAQR